MSKRKNPRTSRGSARRSSFAPPRSKPTTRGAYYKVSRRIADETPNSFYANQYHNPANPESHYLSSAPEIWRQTGGDFDAFVAGMGHGRHHQRMRQVLQREEPRHPARRNDPRRVALYDFVKTGRVTKPSRTRSKGSGKDFFPTTNEPLDHRRRSFGSTTRSASSLARDLTRLEGLFVGGSGARPSRGRSSMPSS